MDLTLLPAVDEIVSCADHARRLAVDPGGSAIRADVLIAAEVPLPWPKPVFDHPMLRGLDHAAATAPVPARVLAAVPLEAAAAGCSVVTYRRRGAVMTRSEVRVGADQLGDAVRAALAGPTDPGADPQDGSSSPPELWVCTQGSHDSCCGRDGTRLATDVVAAGIDVVVRRVSHTGGHRFAPTALTLPDGRMWGYVDPALVGHVIHRSGTPAELAERCRGWTGALTGVAQMAERAVFAAVGWSLDQAQREITVVDDSGGEHPDATMVRVRASWPDGTAESYEVAVATLREVPTIACREPGGLPAKPSREYGIIRLDRI